MLLLRVFIMICACLCPQKDIIQMSPGTACHTEMSQAGTFVPLFYFFTKASVVQSTNGG